MNNFAAFYNRLPFIDVANRLFINREQILSNLAPLLSANGNKFGVCLVHRHCELEEGERMVTNGHVCQPVLEGEYYPERWLATGEAYEFNREPTPSPPQELLKAFQSIVGGVGVLGLFFIRDEGKGGVTLERTEGRRNIVEIVAYDSPRSAITTAWSSTDSRNVVRMVECSQCSSTGTTHIENANKMAGLEQRRDLGHHINRVHSNDD